MTDAGNVSACFLECENGPMRLFLDQPLQQGIALRLTDERAHYVSRVLRSKVDDELQVFNGSGDEYLAVVHAMSKREVVLRVEQRHERNLESPLAITLVQGISRGERMDFVVQKATELGVHRIVPVLTTRSVVRLDGDRGQKRALHWRKIAQSACEQCGRNIVPAVDVPLELSRWLAARNQDPPIRIVLQPGAAESLNAMERPVKAIEILVGPEGGLSDAEYGQAIAAGFEGRSMGPRILRTETAAITAVALVQARLGDLSPPS